MNTCAVAIDTARYMRDQRAAHDAEAICEKAMEDHAPELAKLLADPSALSMALQSIPGDETMADVDRLVAFALRLTVEPRKESQSGQFILLARKLRALAAAELKPAAIALAETRILSDVLDSQEAYLDSRRNR